jgi:iron complex outermembrane receptor protein
MAHGSITADTDRQLGSSSVSRHRFSWNEQGAACIALLAAFATMTLPAWSQQNAQDLTNQSIEDLMNIQVTSVSKTEETLSHTAGAVFVIAQEDIRRSGATNVPDLLRMVPGLDVAQINANTWAVSARGFNGRLSDKLLVLVDGRTVYTPTFAGVFWDTLDLPLENIERIEVIRGPGGSVWGSNAVNGVINIITKKASETSGALVTAGGGTADQEFGTIEYGGKLGDLMDYRVYTKYLNDDHYPNAGDNDGGDGWHMLRGGFRVDSVISSRDTLMFEGDIYSAREGTPTNYLPSVTSPGPVPIETFVNLSGGFLQGVWNHSFSPQSDTSLQISYDAYQRNDILLEGRKTISLDFQDHFSGWSRQSILWGFTYRDSSSTSRGGLLVSLVPPNLNTQLFSGFFQDEVEVLPHQVFLTLGTRIEHNYYSGFDIMPSARVAWTPSPRETLWAAVSKADRTPSEFDASVISDRGAYPGPGGIPATLSVIGNPDVGNEQLIAYELGFRTLIRKQLSLDIASYYNDYSNQDSLEPAAPFFADTPPPPHIVVPYSYKNLMHGETRGIEVAVKWQATHRLSLAPGFAFERIHERLSPSSHDVGSVAAAEGSTPGYSAQLRSHLAIGRGLAWDASAYFVDRITLPAVPSYTRIDTGFSWQIAKSLSASFVGQNLLKDRHEDFLDTFGSVNGTLIKRSTYVKLSWQF